LTIDYLELDWIGSRRKALPLVDECRITTQLISGIEGARSKPQIDLQWPIQISYIFENAVLWISPVGLNRYAVLGRSGRLWSSVVPDQVSLFAILHA
jgi:hypothetical protein